MEGQGPSKFTSVHMIRVRLLAILLSIPAAAVYPQSQAHARYQVYGGYSYLSNSFNGIPGARRSLNGWDASVAFPDWHNLRVKIDVFGFRGMNLAAQQDAYFIMGGGQYDVHLGRETVFAHVLAGDGGINRYWGPNQLPGEVASFSSLIGGGLDTPLTRHLAVRVVTDYQWENLALIQAVTNTVPYRPSGLPSNFFRLSSGAVWNF